MTLVSGRPSPPLGSASSAGLGSFSAGSIELNPPLLPSIQAQFASGSTVSLQSSSVNMGGSFVTQMPKDNAGAPVKQSVLEASLVNSARGDFNVPGLPSLHSDFSSSGFVLPDRLSVTSDFHAAGSPLPPLGSAPSVGFGANSAGSIDLNPPLLPSLHAQFAAGKDISSNSGSVNLGGSFITQMPKDDTGVPGKQSVIRATLLNDVQGVFNEPGLPSFHTDFKSTDFVLPDTVKGSADFTASTGPLLPMGSPSASKLAATSTGSIDLTPPLLPSLHAQFAAGQMSTSQSSSVNLGGSFTSKLPNDNTGTPIKQSLIGATMLNSVEANLKEPGLPSFHAGFGSENSILPDSVKGAAGISGSTGPAPPPGSPSASSVGSSSVSSFELNLPLLPSLRADFISKQELGSDGFSLNLGGIFKIGSGPTQSPTPRPPQPSVDPKPVAPPEPLFPPVLPSPLTIFGKITTGLFGFHSALKSMVTNPFRSAVKRTEFVSGIDLAVATPFIKINAKFGIALIVVR